MKKADEIHCFISLFACLKTAQFPPFRGCLFLADKLLCLRSISAQTRAQAFSSGLSLPVREL